MTKNIKFKGMVAAAAVLLGMSACGNKANEAQADSTYAEDSAFLDTAVVDTPTLDSALTEAADSIAADAKPGEDGYITTASGLKYKVIKKGSGRTPEVTSIVTVNYEGKLLDGTTFDSTYQRGAPADFRVNEIIKGWTEGLQLMQEGAEYEFYIPYQLAYGERGTPGGPIPPKADLIFKVELIQVK